MVRAFGTFGKKRNACRVLVGEYEGKRPPGESRRRGEDNIKTERQEIVQDGVKWIRLAEDRADGGPVCNAYKPYISIKCEFLD
jgi:hypothetical protein